jgi:tetratricopeptide (TPR) repeat protein
VQKRTQKWVVGIIVAIISLTLIGSSFVAIFLPETEQDKQNQSQQILEKEYNERKQIVEALTAKLEGNAEDTETQLALGDAYYDKAIVSAQINVKEHQEDLEKAKEMYQQVLTKAQSSDVMLKLATTAFLLGDSELAEETYNKILQKEPENSGALYGYGMFLFYEKNDYQEAQELWEKALELTTDEYLQQRLEEMIALAKGMELNPNEEEDN